MQLRRISHTCPPLEFFEYYDRFEDYLELMLVRDQLIVLDISHDIVRHK